MTAEYRNGLPPVHRTDRSDRRQFIQPMTGAHILDENSDVILRRTYGEFLEMPGLRLTLQQAQRIWGLDRQACLQLLEFLVDAKFLCRSLAACTRA